MKKLFVQLLEFLKEDFDWVVYLGTALMLAGLMVANYQYDVFDAVQKSSRNPLQMIPIALFYGVPWMAVFLLQAARGRHTDGRAFDSEFVRIAAVALFVVSFVDWFPFHYDIVDQFPKEIRRWTRGVLWNCKTTVLWFTPMALYWWAFDRDQKGVTRLYGFTTEGFDVKPYLLCLTVIAPLVTWASFQPDFLRTYPTYKPWYGVETYLDVHPLVTVIPYELIYGFDFSFVEMYFRGFLIIGMARWLGRNAVLPMVAMYAVLHFGKPMFETIGSIIGGYILGVFALRSRSILGGIMLHLGMAWSMEAAAFAQHYFNK